MNSIEVRGGDSSVVGRSSISGSSSSSGRRRRSISRRRSNRGVNSSSSNHSLYNALVRSIEQEYNQC